MSERQTGQNYYEVLEVPTTAGPMDIYNAYQRARSTYSPSSPALYSMFSPEEAQQLLSLIEEAYQTLSHQGKRREYDSKIGLTVEPTRSADVSQARMQAQSARGTTPSGTAAHVVHKATASKTQDHWVGPVRVTTTQKEQLPSGFARTKFSVFEVNPALEREIETIEECDGKWLQKIRLYKGITLEQLSEEIRVIKSTLVALEANDVEALPVAVFTRGFVVQIARILGLNERKITDSYMKFFKAKKSES